MAKFIRPRLLIPFSLFLAWIFDYFFWGKAAGISFPLFIALLVGSGLWLATQANLRPAKAAWWLLVPILLLALVSVFRTEPLTLFTSRLLTVVLLGVFVLSFLGGRWPRYGFADYVSKLIGLLPYGLGELLTKEKSTRRKAGDASLLSRLAPVGRGLLLALPLLWFLSVLLSSADAYFAEWMNSLFFDVEKAPEYVLRAVIILGLTYALAASYMYAFNRSQDKTLLGERKPVIAPLLGFGEAVTMLASVIVLLGSFVAVQFRYFFGGMANIVEGPVGFTFAEYARRGFAELVIVALTTLGFFIVLSSLSRRQTGRQQNWFSGLGIGLFVLVAVILVSAFQRLLLLEEAYGFTRLRTYPHMFMIWLGILLLAVVVLEAMGRQRAFALAVLLATLGFTLTLPLLNVDAFIARINVERAMQGAELDAAYLGSLSNDAVPVLAAGYKATAGQDAELADQLAIAIACHFAINKADDIQPWSAWTRSLAVAQDLWASLKGSLDFPARVSSQTVDSLSLPIVTIHGQEVPCYGTDSDPFFP